MTLAIEQAREPLALHTAPGFRWQYLHVVDKAAVANAVLHDTDIFGFGRSPYVSVCHDALGHSQHARAWAPGLRYGIDDAVHTAGGVQRTPGGHRVEVSAGPLKLRGRVTGQAGPPGGAFTTTLLTANGRCSYWQVLRVGARFDGTASAGDQEQALSGAFYMDRQWGDLPLQHAVGDWIWGHLVGEEFELVYFHVLTKQGAPSIRTLLRRGSTWQTGANLRDSYLYGLRSQAFAEIDGEQGLAMGCGPEKVEARLRLTPGALLRAREGEQHPGFSASYARWRTTGVISDARSGQVPVVGMSECLRIR